MRDNQQSMWSCRTRLAQAGEQGSWTAQRQPSQQALPSYRVCGVDPLSYPLACPPTSVHLLSLLPSSTASCAPLMPTHPSVVQRRMHRSQMGAFAPRDMATGWGHCGGVRALGRGQGVQAEIPGNSEGLSVSRPCLPQSSSCFLACG